MNDTVDYTSLKSTARIAGWLYLIIILTAGFGEGAVRSALVVFNSAATTAENIVASQGLYRLGLVADLIAFICDAAVAVLLYVVLRPVNKTMALVAAAFRLLAHPAIAAVNLINHFMPLALLTGSGFAGAFEAGQTEALSLMYLNAHRTGYLIAGAFFGVHVFLLGYLIMRSSYISTALGGALLIAAVGYLVESFGNLLVPQYAAIYAWIVAVPAVIAEVWLFLWLVIKGVRSPEAQELASSSASNR